MADVGRFPWLPLDPEPRPELLATLEASVANGSYWIPAPEISRLLVDDHITVWP